MEAFKELCGPGEYHGVTLLTTFWDVVKQNEEVQMAALRRQEELDTSPHFGQQIIAQGGHSVALRPGREHALALLDDIVRRRHRLVLTIQIELTANPTLHETATGRVLRDGHQRDMAQAEEVEAEARV